MVWTTGASRELSLRAMDIAKRNDAKETAATYLAAHALREVEAGEYQRGMADATAATELASNRDVRAMSALAMAQANRVPEAQKLVEELDKTYPLDTFVCECYFGCRVCGPRLPCNKPAGKAVDIRNLNRCRAWPDDS